MTGSPIISVNLTSQKNPANLNYHMRLRKVKRLSLVFGFRWAQKTKPCFVTLGTFFSFLFPLSSFLLPLSSFLFPLSSFFFNFLLAPSSFLIPLSSFLFPTAGHLVFWKSWPAVDLEKVLSITKCHAFIFWALRVNQMLNLRPIKRFRIVWLFLINIW